MRTSTRKFVTATAASAVFAGGLMGLSASPAAAHPDCDDVYKRKYTEISSTWHKVVASGTIDNRRSSASVRESISAEISASLKGTVSGEIGGKIDIAVAEINSKMGVSVEAGVSIAKGKTTMIVVPARKRVSYKIGIKKRVYQVAVSHQFRSCAVSNSYAKVTVADSYTETKNT
ncbi:MULTISPECIES: hypothetical protein [Streptomyces]|uniref:hypothetical protein n=1 Tax=Streptomyces TaxID=1883 RepID=UPI001587139E|nr:hypothetical protein [Streptomyces sp. CAI-85]MBO7935047.1 hypothetical protein [Streptomyces sp. S9]NUV58787.1 hypothetical protein [Streptomyces sp. CAI-85]